VRKLTVFNTVSLDGFFCDLKGDMSFAHRPPDPEWNDFVSSNASGSGLLVFGRVTYQMMASYWPTAEALKNDPVVAKGMNESRKLVFSRTLAEAAWRNTTLVKGDPAAEIRRLKSEPGPGMAVLGSGSIVAQLAQERLIDELQLVVVPAVLGSGRTLFEGVTELLHFTLLRSKAFRNGNVLLCYEPGA
jgi:dihydrofolate reductase